MVTLTSLERANLNKAYLSEADLSEAEHGELGRPVDSPPLGLLISMLVERCFAALHGQVDNAIVGTAEPPTELAVDVLHTMAYA